MKCFGRLTYNMLCSEAHYLHSFKLAFTTQRLHKHWQGNTFPFHHFSGFISCKSFELLGSVTHVLVLKDSDAISISALSQTALFDLSQTRQKASIRPFVFFPLPISDKVERTSMNGFMEKGREKQVDDE